jgi:subtilase family serine protease
MMIWRCALLAHNRARGLFGRRYGFHCVTPGQRMRLRWSSMFRELGLPTFPLIALGVLFAVNSASAQVQSGLRARPLITEKIDDRKLVTLQGNVHPEAKAENDRGEVADNFTIDHMLLQLRRSPEQEQELEQFIDELHTVGSPKFHHWVTTQKFGETFGLATQDLDTIVGWLESYGFKVNVIYSSGMLIDFSGTAGQVRKAFHTEVHNLEVNGEKHIANMSDPRIPAAFAPAVVGIVSLHDFQPHPMYKMRKPLPLFTESNGYYSLVPADLATIYNLNPVFTAGYSGKGQTIALIEDTDLFSASDWNTFRSKFGLSTYTSGSLTTVHPTPPTGPNNCMAPGVVSPNDGEAILDAEWASAAAPSAAIEMAVCADTTTTFGGLIAVQNLINGVAPPPAIMSISYGQCETVNGSSANAAYNAAYQQAVAEGVSVFVAAGDSGAAGCDDNAAAATDGVGVSAFASTVYNVAVGGTDFSDTFSKDNSTYWNATNTSTFSSAKSYIPEIPWNDSCASVLVAKFLGFSQTYGTTGFCNNSSVGMSLHTTAAGSGGPSGCATGAPVVPDLAAVGGSCAGWPKPLWQSIFGNPSDGVRDIPDVSLFAANGLWSHYYVYCWSDTAAGGAACTGDPSTWSGAGGTSFASPIMAAIQSLVDQKTGSRQGNPNPVYYQLASVEYGSTGNSSCDSSKGNAIATTCIFNDVTLGDMDVNCSFFNKTHIYNCYDPGGTFTNALMGALSTSNSSYSPAFGTTKGWDFATGIGTVNAANLVSNWPTSVPNLGGMWDLRLSNTANPPPGQMGETEFTFDVVVQSSSASTEALSNNGFQDHTFTNSICSAPGTGNDVTMSANFSLTSTVTFQISVDNGESYSMTGTLSSDGTTVTGTSVKYNAGSQNCGKNDVSSGFTAILYKPATGTYVGSFTPDAGGTSFTSTIVLVEDANYNLTGTVTSTGNTCFANLTINGKTDPSLASGDVLDFFGTDGQGNLAGFIANAGGSSNTAGDTNWQQLFVHSVVYGGACNGQSYTDAPFHRVGGRPKRSARR